MVCLQFLTPSVRWKRTMDICLNFYDLVLRSRNVIKEGE
jgi:hypothetical protein